MADICPYSIDEHTLISSNKLEKYVLECRFKIIDQVLDAVGYNIKVVTSDYDPTNFFGDRTL